VDPLDGTVNYVHLFPTFCVSIGFCVHGKSVVGVIFAPALGALTTAPDDSQNGTLYSAAKGHGAWMTNVTSKNWSNLIASTSTATPRVLQPTPESLRLPLLKPTPPLSLQAPRGCIYVSEWGQDRRETPEGNLWRKVESFWNMAGELGSRGGKGGMVHGIRSLGS
jgi:myo-inositol-1(or 4)-monophosphatase